MSKHKIIGVVALVLFLLGGYFTYTSSNNKRQNSNTQVKHIVEADNEQPTPTVTEAEFIEEQLKDYYAVYKNPYVLHIRKAIDGYLNGSNLGIDDPESVIKSDKLGGNIIGLSSFDKSYYKSKFIVYDINNFLGGGKQINIIFQDKPDSVFGVWVYRIASGEYDLRGFWKINTYTEDNMNEIRKRYKAFLVDEEHSL